MKVGQGQGRAVEGLRAQKQHGERRQSKVRGEKGQRFAELLERKTSPTEQKTSSLAKGVEAEEIFQDEEGRRLEAGELQREERDEGLQLLERTGRGAVGEEPLPQIKGEKWVEREGRDVEVQKEEPFRAEIFDARGGLGQKELSFEGAMKAEGVMQGSDGASRVAAVEKQSDAESLEHIARQIVQAAQVGEDGQGRRVMFLDVTVPGYGDVRIRLRQDGGGLEVRMRADNDGLAQTLRQYSERLRSSAGEQGVQLTSIQVVR